MMKKEFYIVWIAGIITVLTSCRNNDVNVFDKTADERVTQAIASLKADLTAPANGWRVKYRPEDASGSFYVLMKFTDDQKLIIKTDLTASDDRFLEDTITYRIDNSLGLELILENYCFFSYLFEQDDATFGAEYEFHYVNKAADHSLIFNSKTDPSNPTTLVFEEASASDINLLGTQLSKNINLMAKDIDKITVTCKLTYDTKDLVFYISLDESKRILNINTASKKTNTASTQIVDFTTGYLISGDSIIFDEPLSGTFLSNSISIKSIKFSILTNTVLNICASPINTHAYKGITSANHPVTLETSLLDVSGKDFATQSSFYDAPLNNILHNGKSARNEVAQDIAGATSFQLYYNYDIGSPFYALGFRIENNDGTVTFALREFTPTLTDNNIKFNFAPGLSLFGNEETDADTTKINNFIGELANGNNTYVFKYSNNVYEFYNPCTAWSVVFLNGN